MSEKTFSRSLLAGLGTQQKQFIQAFNKDNARPANLEFLGKLAASSPALALMAARYGVVTSPRILSQRYTFENTVQDPVTVAIDVRQSFMIVTDIVYDVQRPNFYPGNIAKAESDLANAKLPGIMIKMAGVEPKKCRDYTINCPEPTPIQHIFRQSTSYNPTDFLANWRIAFPDEFTLTLWLDRVLGDGVLVPENNEIPYIVDVSFKGFTIPCPPGRVYEQLAEEDTSSLQQALMEAGISIASCMTVGGGCGSGVLLPSPVSTTPRPYAIQEVTTRTSHVPGGTLPLRPSEGTQPERGSTAYNYIDIPSDPLDRGRLPGKGRYLFRLCGVAVPKGTTLHVVGLRQMLVLGGTIPNLAGDPLPVETEVTSPLWHPRDANVCWALRREPLIIREGTNTAVIPPSTTPTYNGIQQGLVYRTLAPYVPPADGYFPGKPPAYGDLGLFNDMRFPWQTTDCCLNLEFAGPCNVSFYASVMQSALAGPLARPSTALPAGLTPAQLQAVSALRAEDRFLSLAEDAIYTKIAGSLLYTLERTPQCC